VFHTRSTYLCSSLSLLGLTLNVYHNFILGGLHPVSLLSILVAHMLSLCMYVVSFVCSDARSIGSGGLPPRVPAGADRANPEDGYR